MFSKNIRRYDIDTLRIFAVYLLFLFHTIKVFDVNPFYQVKNSELIGGLDLISGFIHTWHMPLLFFLAGWSVQASLKKRSTKQFLKERFFRIFVPFVFGVIIFCPLMQYYYMVNFLSYQNSFFIFIPEFFSKLPHFSWSHLWFIIYLFVFILLYIPFLNYFIKKKLKKTSTLFIYLPLVIFIIIQLTLRERWPGFQNLYDDWANFSYYSCYFLFGFFIAHVKYLENKIHQLWNIHGVIALLSFILLIQGIIMNKYIIYVLHTIACYFSVLFLLGFSNKYFLNNWKNNNYFSEASYPVYILHQFFIVVPAYFITKLNWNWIVKFIFLFILSIFLTQIFYHFIIRKFNVFRFMFGMKNKTV